MRVICPEAEEASDELAAAVLELLAGMAASVRFESGVLTLSALPPAHGYMPTVPLLTKPGVCCGAALLVDEAVEAADEATLPVAVAAAEERALKTLTLMLEPDCAWAGEAASSAGSRGRTLEKRIVEEGAGGWGA